MGATPGAAWRSASAARCPRRSSPKARPSHRRGCTAGVSCRSWARPRRWRASLPAGHRGTSSSPTFARPRRRSPPAKPSTTRPRRAWAATPPGSSSPATTAVPPRWRVTPSTRPAWAPPETSSWPASSISTTRAAPAASARVPRRSPSAASSASSPRSRPATRRTAASGCASSPARRARPPWPSSSGGCWRASRRRGFTPGRASPTTRCATARRWPSASPSSRATSSARPR